MAAMKPEPWLWALITTNNNHYVAQNFEVTPDVSERKWIPA
jgi:hypothetical protein